MDCDWELERSRPLVGALDVGVLVEGKLLKGTFEGRLEGSVFGPLVMFNPVMLEPVILEPVILEPVM